MPQIDMNQMCGWICDKSHIGHILDEIRLNFQL